jgi:hypothetical protein
MKNIGGIATWNGKRIAFPVQEGYGLVAVDDTVILLEFSCPMESHPPVGTATEVAGTLPISIFYHNRSLGIHRRRIVMGELLDKL